MLKSIENFVENKDNGLMLLDLPTGFGNAGDFAFISQLTETNTADAEFTHISMRTTADFAAVVASYLELGCPLLLSNHRFLSHKIPS